MAQILANAAERCRGRRPDPVLSRHHRRGRGQEEQLLEEVPQEEEDIKRRSGTREQIDSWKDFNWSMGLNRAIEGQKVNPLDCNFDFANTLYNRQLAQRVDEGNTKKQLPYTPDMPTTCLNQEWHALPKFDSQVILSTLLTFKGRAKASLGL